MSFSGSKPWVLAIGAALAIAGGIYFLHIQKNNTLMKEIMREVDALGPAERDASGKVSFAYLKAVYIIADKSASKRFKPFKEKFIRKRRDLLKQNNLEEYKKVVVEMNESESLINNETLIETMAYVGVDCYKTFFQHMENRENSSELRQARVMASVKK